MINQNMPFHVFNAHHQVQDLYDSLGMIVFLLHMRKQTCLPSLSSACTCSDTPASIHRAAVPLDALKIMKACALDLQMIQTDCLSSFSMLFFTF